MRINTRHMRSTPQRERVRADQVEMSSGGYGWEASEMERLRRFLMLGVEGGTFYLSERKLTRENAQNVLELVRTNGPEVVAEVVAIAKDRRAFRMDPVLFTLAACAALGDDETRDAAYASLPIVCGIPTHLFGFNAYWMDLKGNRSMGRKHRRAIAAWYNEKDPERLAFLVSKYKSREGWSHRDLVRMAHVKPDGPQRENVISWAVGASGVRLQPAYMKTIKAFEWAKKAESAEQIVQLIHDARLSWEHVPSEYLKSDAVWRALLPNLGYTALLRNLNRLPMAPLSDDVGAVIERIEDDVAISKSGVHPMRVLLALKTYSMGRGFRGSMTWQVNQDVVSALDSAFYKSFGNLEASGKRMLLLVDVSGSMGSPIAGTPLSCRDAAAAISLVLKAQEGHKAHIWGFSSQLVELEITPRNRLDDVIRTMGMLPFGGTDASVGIRAAYEQGLDVDHFVCLTDNESWCGPEQVFESLARYRKKVGHGVSFSSVAFAANRFTLADPRDKRMIDFVGFDAALPDLIKGFARGDF